MDISKGTKIVCSGGHEVGRVLETIPTGAPITAEKIQIDSKRPVKAALCERAMPAKS